MELNNIWIIDPYSDFPEEGWRQGRYYLISEKLSLNGYKVNFFISNFDHKKKRFSDKTGIYSINSNFKIIVVPTSSYSCHISLQRIMYERNFAKRIIFDYKNYDCPNIIILKDPAIFMFDLLKNFISTSKAKLIIDIIDLWPELFVISLPRKIRFLNKILFSPFYLMRINIYKAASAFTAVAPDYLDIPNQVNVIVPRQIIYWGCDRSAINFIIKNQDYKILNRLNLFKNNDDIFGIYAGTLGQNYDILTLLKAAVVLENIIPNLKFIIAGAGPLENLVLKYSKSSKNIIYLGSLPTSQLYELFSHCDFGFSSYSDVSTVSMPIKFYDYLAAGLPLVNSLGRNLGLLVEKHNIGYQYIPNNINSLVEVLLRLMSEKERLVEMKDCCIKLSESFDNDYQYGKYVNFIRDFNQ